MAFMADTLRNAVLGLTVLLMTGAVIALWTAG